MVEMLLEGICFISEKLEAQSNGGVLMVVGSKIVEPGFQHSSDSEIMHYLHILQTTDISCIPLIYIEISLVGSISIFGQNRIPNILKCHHIYYHKGILYVILYLKLSHKCILHVHMYVSSQEVFKMLMDIHI